MEIRKVIYSDYDVWDPKKENIILFYINDGCGYGGKLYVIDISENIEYRKEYIYVSDEYLINRKDEILNNEKRVEGEYDGYLLIIDKSTSLVCSKKWNELYLDNYSVISYADWLVKRIVE